MRRRREKAVGQRVPPLSTSNKRQLDQYSDGQILRELLQNAEDAGAQELRLTVDCRRFQAETILKCKNERANEEFKVCQGPALVAWNDAEFTARDWESIQKPMRSEKERDPDSIGRFGLGFLSVYHLTDFPWIVSGNRIMVLDPRETGMCVAEVAGNSTVMTGLDFYLDDPESKEEMRELEDQFEPFHHLNLMGKETVSGSFFRFPLRRNPSIISSTLYSVSTSPVEGGLSLESLFEAFVAGDEGKNLLLFLSSVRRVSLWIHDADSEEPRRIYQVSADRSDSTTRITVEQSDTTELHQWIIEHEFYGRHNSDEATKRKKPKSKVAVAAESPFTKDPEQNYGYTYCFLPIPFVEANETGLPVHVHGDFLLNDNRRNVIWPTSDNQHNAGANANLNLAHETVPKVSLRLLNGIKNSSGTNKEKNFWISDLWPDLNDIRNGAFKTAACNFYHLLQDQKVFWSPFAQQWISSQDATFLIRMEAGYRTAVEKFLALAKVPVVPYEADTFLVNHSRVTGIQSMEMKPTVLAGFLRTSFKKVQSKFDAKERKTILRYLTSTSTISIDDLEGLEILPLLDGSFTQFRKRSSEADAIFVATDSIAVSLFPGLESTILDPDFTNNLRPVIDLGRSQLRFLKSKDIPWLVKAVLDNNATLPTGYLEKLWEFLRVQSNSIRLKDMVGLSILPLRKESNVDELDDFSYRPQSHTVALKDHFYYLSASNIDPHECINLEREISIPLIEPESYLSHPDINKFVFVGHSSTNIVRSLMDFTLATQKLPQELILDQCVPFLMEKFSQISNISMDPNSRQFIASLKIFPSYGGGSLISAEDSSDRYLDALWAKRLDSLEQFKPIAHIDESNPRMGAVAFNLRMKRMTMEIAVTEIVRNLQNKKCDYNLIFGTVFSWPREELERSSELLGRFPKKQIAAVFLSLIERAMPEVSQSAQNMAWFFAKDSSWDWVSFLQEKRCIPCTNNCLHLPSSIILSSPITTCPQLCLPRPEIDPRFLDRLEVRKTYRPLIDGPQFLAEMFEAYASESLSPGTIDNVLMALRKIADGISCRQDFEFDLYLPDKDSIMRPLDQLVYATSDLDKNGHFEAHPDISREAAKKFGMRVERDVLLKQYESDDEDDNWGEEFGQEIDLTQRIKRLVEQYHAPNDFIQEFAQNAEDARARKLTFIIDEREHSTENLLNEHMVGLQGPALLVYNSATFSKKDFAGIQKLGIGSKGDDREKIGRFGAGFNCAYGYTDCPIFISDNQNLCVLDPLRRYLAFNKAKRPGKKYTVTSRFADQFKGTWDTFKIPNLIEDFPLEGGTLFRLPLRQAASPLWDDVITPKDVSDMLHSAKNDIMRMLLFLSHVEEVSAYRVSPSGKLLLFWEVKATDRISVCDLTPAEFSARAHNAAVNRTAPEDVALAKASFKLSLKMEDPTGSVTESWLISQRMGFDYPLNPNGEKTDTKKVFSDKIKLLPLGGVAKLLTPMEQNQHPVTDLLFVSLPLPTRTGLPVALHGHFCLDSEGRKNFWTSCRDQKDERKQWNETILSRILAPAYADLLESLTHFKELSRSPPEKAVGLRHFWNAFPDPAATSNTDWGKFAKDVYTCAMRQNILAIPCRTPEKTSWRRPLRETGDSFPVFFFSHELKKELRTLFTIMGMDLVCDAPNFVTREFKLSKMVQMLDPELVSSVFRSNSILLCEDTFPCHVNQTKFFAAATGQDHQRIDNSCKLVLETLNFILEIQDGGKERYNTGSVPKAEPNIRGLPLLVTQDQCIQEIQPIFKPILSSATDISSLFPKSRHHFAQKFYENIWQKQGVGKEIFLEPKIEDLPQFLHEMCPSNFCEGTDFIDYRNLSDICPPQWLNSFWNVVIGKLLPRAWYQLEGHDAISYLNPLSNWKLIPSVNHNYRDRSPSLCSLNMRDVVLSSSMKSELKNLPLGLPSISTDALRYEYQYVEGITILDKIFVNDHVALAQAIQYWNSRQNLDWTFRSLNESMSPGQQQRVARTFRDYYNESAQRRADYEKMLEKAPNRRNVTPVAWPASLNSILRSLPIYQTESGNLISVMDLNVYVKPSFSRIPAKGMEHCSQNNTVFLKPGLGASQLFEKLGIKELEDSDVMIKFVLPAFPRMRIIDQVAHLKFIRNECFRDDEKSQAIPNQLKTTPFIEGSRRISEFYSSETPVFKLMMDHSKFLPQNLVTEMEKVMKRDWIELFERMGFKIKPTIEDLILLANNLGASDANDANVSEKAEAIMKASLGLPKDQIAGTIDEIKFIPSCLIGKKIGCLYPLNRKRIKLISLAEGFPFEMRQLLWSECDILPPWASYYHQHFIRKDVSETLIHIVNHAATVLSHQMCSKNEEPKSEGVNSTETIGVLNEYLSSLYQELKDNLPLLDVHFDQLSALPMIAVEKGTRLIAPNMVVKHLSDEIPPYLYRLPESVTEFRKLFKRIGMLKLPAAKQYAAALESFHTKKAENLNDPNVRSAVRKAQKGIIQIDSPDWDKTDSLYLLNTKSSMTKSSELIFMNKFQENNNTLLNPDHALIWDVPKDLEQLKIKAFIKSLPDRLKPKLFSQIITDSMCVDNSEVCSHECCQVQVKMEETLHSEELFESMKRLFYAEKDTLGPDDAWSDCENLLQSITVKCFKRIKIVSSHIGSSEVVREKEAQFFAKMDETGSYEFRVNHKAATERAVTIAAYVAEKLGESSPLESCTKYATTLQTLLSVEIDEMQSILDEQELPYPSTNEEEGDLKLGAILPPDLVKLIKQHPAMFFVDGEFVGYCKETYTDDEAELKIILAQVIRSVEPACETIGKRYMIKCSEDENDELEVSNFDLYKFHADAGEHFWQLVPVGVPQKVSRDEQENVFQNLTDLKEAKEHVTEFLEKVWKLCDSEKKKAVRRLMLEWHPDKNPNRIELATEVFKHIQAEIDRLKKGLPRRGSNNGKSRPYDHSNGGSDYFDFDDMFNSYRRNWSNFESRPRGNARSNRGFRSQRSSRNNRPNPNLGKAYMEQARHDLNAARHECSEIFGNENAIFLARRAAELAMKALIISKTGEMGDTRSLHDLSQKANPFLRYVALDDLVEQFILESNPDLTLLQYPTESDCKTPREKYTELQKFRALRHVEGIIAAIETKMN